MVFSVCDFLMFNVLLLLLLCRTCRWCRFHPRPLVTSSRETVTLFYTWVDSSPKRLNNNCLDGMGVTSVPPSVLFTRRAWTRARASLLTSTTGSGTPPPRTSKVRPPSTSPSWTSTWAGVRCSTGRCRAASRHGSGATSRMASCESKNREGVSLSHTHTHTLRL